MKQFVLMLLLLFCLLIFHRETIDGVQNGLLLWYQTLIPSLLPFILVTNALSETNAYQAAASCFQKYCPHRIYEIMAVLMGNLCGYPIGGKIISDFVNNRYIDPIHGNWLLALSSQSSPMFLIGYVYIHILNESIPLPIFLLSIYLPVLIYYPFFASYHRQKYYTAAPSATNQPCISDTFLHSVQIMVSIGIYVIIFSVFLGILLPICKIQTFKIFLSFMEITTGLKLLNSLELSQSLQLSLICALSAFGGFCSAFQIKGVLDYPGASIKKYLLDKLFLSAGTFFIMEIYLHI
ncbi:MAG: hypothetical protein K2H34_05510 [Lachnospiraceae bacterium]|nr:hypothetical protein [Lachnospiraceae bacterium]